MTRFDSRCFRTEHALLTREIAINRDNINSRALFSPFLIRFQSFSSVLVRSPLRSRKLSLIFMRFCQFLCVVVDSTCSRFPCAPGDLSCPLGIFVSILVRSRYGRRLILGKLPDMFSLETTFLCYLPLVVI